MRIVLWGNGNRGVRCFEALRRNGYNVVAVVGHPQQGDQRSEAIIELAKRNTIPFICPEYSNDGQVTPHLRGMASDVLVLAGYGKILRKRIIDTPKIICINLHAWKLLMYRGSDPR